MIPLLKISNLYVNFQVRKSKFSAVKNFNLLIEKNQIVGLVGESGSGKSVTAMSIMRLLQEPINQIDYIIINPGALTHTSIAIRDCLLGIGVPFYEVHISNIFAREEFRHKSFFSDIASGVICGLGTQGYELALSHIIKCNQDKK